MSIASNIIELKKQLPEGVQLIAVSKTKPVSDIQEAYDCGQRDFGENKVQELNEKASQLPKDIRWHLIGHLQSNKVKYIVPFVHLIHSVDSLGLLEEINKQAVKNNRVIDCLLQFHIAEEESKFGLTMEAALALIEQSKSMQNIRFRGVMGMATFTENQQQIAAEFKNLKKIFTQLLSEQMKNNASFDTISMGMSDDYPLAIECGSTMVRVGSKLFGGR
ncbi:MAG: YggS family pyridoxal phosphate-dependent enzyme [Bacteroidota bacterium]